MHQRDSYPAYQPKTKLWLQAWGRELARRLSSKNIKECSGIQCWRKVGANLAYIWGLRLVSCPCREDVEGNVGPCSSCSRCPDSAMHVGLCVDDTELIHGAIARRMNRGKRERACKRQKVQQQKLQPNTARKRPQGETRHRPQKAALIWARTPALPSGLGGCCKTLNHTPASKPACERTKAVHCMLSCAVVVLKAARSACRCEMTKAHSLERTLSPQLRRAPTHTWTRRSNRDEGRVKDAMGSGLPAHLVPMMAGGTEMPVPTYVGNSVVVGWLSVTISAGSLSFGADDGWSVWRR